MGEGVGWGGRELRWLQRLAVAGPLLFFLALEGLRAVLLRAGLPAGWGVALAVALVAGASWLFARRVFALLAALRSRLEQALDDAQREQARLTAVLDASVDGIYVVGENERITLANRTLERLLGLPREQIVGQRCFGHTTSHTRDGRLLCESACPFREPLRHRYPTEIAVTTPVGPRSLEIASGRILGASGEIEGVVHVLRDLTARKEVEGLQDEFISLVSHELRTPLNHIKGFASTLLQEDVEWERETQRDFLQTIDQEADRLTHLVENILEMARLAPGEAGARLRLEWHAADDLLHTVLERQRLFAPDHSFVTDIAPHLPPLRCDRRTVEVLLGNLLDNAVKYSPPGSPVTVRAWGEAGHLHVAVTNEGEGIPPEARAHLFQRFYRGANRQRAPGTGLGLAIAQRVAHAHGGTVALSSQPAAPTTFTVTLPLGGPDDAQTAYLGRG